MNNKTFTTRNMTLIAVLGALSAVLMAINMPLPFMPPFLKFDIADFPALFAAFFMGPMSACIIVVLKNLIELVITGTDTAYVGELMNVFMSIAFVLPASLIYSKNRTLKGSRMALIFSVIIGTVTAVLLNYFVALPMYASVYGMPIEAIIGMTSDLNPLVDNMFTLLVFAIAPFNLIKHGVASVVTLAVYKRAGNTIRQMMLKNETQR